MSRADESAFPSKQDTYSAENGLTKRELFAAMAMQGMLADHTLAIGYGKSEGDELMENTVSSAVRYADALLAELEKTNEKP